MIVKEYKGNKREAIQHSEQLSPIFYSLLNQIKDEFDKDVEHFWVAHLDTGNKILLIELVGMGTINGCAVNVKRVYQRALTTNRAKSIICCHNHPSGNLNPSREDKIITKKLGDAGKILTIDILDHLIIGNTDNENSDFYSFADNGLI